MRESDFYLVWLLLHLEIDVGCSRVNMPAHATSRVNVRREELSPQATGTLDFMQAIEFLTITLPFSITH